MSEAELSTSWLAGILVWSYGSIPDHDWKPYVAKKDESPVVLENIEFAENSESGSHSIQSFCRWEI